ncbi:amino acid adenylation domain-containing protein [Acaryochloris sp. IP29b_bin.148]|uniref:non-ribosomal peptide synthetase n=1 Tax=Acaryochloris sp. IP29b_bin.148 TaxID=2969218 RepID=UPI002626A645|nr:non-ribosomal peptide synthetase [Acaryochloris sp. IP29b_bin.148]
MTHLSESKASLSTAEKRALLAKLLRDKVNQENQTYPLSYNQKSLWYLYQSDTSSAAYNLAFSARICSDVDTFALERAFQCLIDRHAILRTTYATENGEAIQIVHKKQQVSFEKIDSSSWTFDQLNQQVIESYRQPFDLKNGPVIRVNLFSSSAQDHILLVTIHHIAYDGWSHWLILNELKAFYLAEVNNTPSTLPELSQQYSDYAGWQSNMLSGPEGEELWQYWQQQLAGNLPILNLPTDYPRPTLLTYEGSSHLFKINKELTSKLKELAQSEGVTLYTLLVAAFQVLLYRYTGQEDILIGTPTLGRNQIEFSKTVGDFVNPIVIRGFLGNNPRFTDFLANVRTNVLNSLDHQDCPFPFLVERLRPDRDLSSSPIFQVLFNYLKPQNIGEVTSLLIPNDKITQIEWAGLKLESFHIEQQVGQFDLDLEIFETEDELISVFNYKTDLFVHSTITRLSENFQTLLTGIIADPCENIANLSLLPQQQKDKLLVEWNQTQTADAQQECYHQLFERQALQTPDAIAVIHRDRQLTYQELNSRANQLAHYLRHRGIDTDQIVGICVERSLEMAIGFLGIFKAGGAYLPLDPKYPSERLAFMIEDSQAPIILTQKHLLETLPSHNAQVICLDEDWPLISEQSISPLSHTVSSENLAYIIYTSGSTGKPKGVMIPHKGLVNHNLAMAKQFGLTENDRVLQFASISFDIAVEELFPTWLRGATIILRPEEILSSIPEFLKFVLQEQITILNFPTAFWHELVNGMQQLQLDLPQTVRLVVVGGEKASRAIYQTWVKRVGDRCRWLNTYGPTETSVTATAYEPGIELESDSRMTEIPIGRPIDNVQIYVLDQQLQPVPIGVPGELHIGGAGVARGYLNRPALSDEKFIPHPFSHDSEAKLYKTGDLVYYRPDGNIMFLGRGDDQIKIRGFRIELGEIESALEQHPDIREAVILAHEDQPGDKRLVAYLAADPKQLSTKDIRRYLKERLPIYMVPSAFVMLEVLPLTPNGKVDRRSLPAPDFSRVEQEETFVAPRSETEQQLAKIWCNVLRIKEIGIHDNFFDLGGNSLLAVSLFQEIEQKLSVSLPLSSLLQNPTIEQLAHTICQDEDSTIWSSLVPIHTNGTKPPLFCIHGGGFNVLIYHDLAKHLGSDYPVYGIQAQGLDGSTVLHGSYEEMAADYIRHLQTVQPEGPYFLSGVSSGGVIALEMAQQLHAQGHKVALVAMFDTSGPDNEGKVLDPIPRFFSVLKYVLNYTLPRFINKRMQVGPTALVRDAIQEFQKLLKKKSSEQASEEVVNLPFEEDISNSIKVLPREMNKLEGWVHHFHLWVLRRSQLAYAAPEVEVLGRGGSFSEVAEKLKASHYKAWIDYECKPYPGTITIFKAHEQLPGFYVDPQMGWGSIAQDGVEIYSVPGYHADLVKSPMLAEGMQACINKAINHTHAS